MCTSFENDFVYMEDSETTTESSSLVTPETLWKLYDQNEMLTLCKVLHQFSTQRIHVVDCLSLAPTPFDSLNSELLTEFPHIAAEKCVTLLLSGDSLVEQEILSLFAAFISFTAPSDISSSISHFLTISSDHFSVLLKNVTLDSIIAVIMQLNRILQSLLIVLTSPSIEVFDAIPTPLPPEWREQGKQTLSTDLKNWLDLQFTSLEDLSATVGSEVHTIAQLADMKRMTAREYSKIGTRCE